MRAILVLFLSAFLLAAQVQEVRAQAAPAFNSVVNNAVGKIIQYKAGAQGLAANSNVVAATMNGVGGAASVVAAGVASSLVAGTAIAWLPLLATAAAVGVTTVVVTAGVQWAFGSDGKVTVSGAAVPQQQYQIPAATAGTKYYATTDPNGKLVGGTTMQAAAEAYLDAYRTNNSGCVSGSIASGNCKTVAQVYGSPISYSSPLCSSSTLSCTYTYSGGPYGPTAKSSSIGLYGPTYSQAAAPSGCATGTWSAGSCISLSSDAMAQLSASNGPTPQTLSQAIAAVPSSVQSQALDAGLLATMANKLWQQAAQIPGYQGLPYSMSNPITAADVSAWQAANPSLYPSVGDALSPVAPAATAGTAIPVVPMPNTAVQTSPTTTPSTNPATNPSTTVTVSPQAGPVTIDVTLNLGPDPGVQQPALEQTPTAQSILDPITSLLPGLKSV